jgi:hypothetical protein
MQEQKKQFVCVLFFVVFVADVVFIQQCVIQCEWQEGSSTRGSSSMTSWLGMTLRAMLEWKCSRKHS